MEKGVETVLGLRTSRLKRYGGCKPGLYKVLGVKLNRQ